MAEHAAVEIRAGTVLPARRENIVLRTADGLDLVGELALPPRRDPVATLVCLHPLPTAGGMMDSHLLRKASYRLPALADLAVLRFNTRGTSSERGTSGGEFGGGGPERGDVAAAIEFCVDRRAAQDLAARLVVRHRAGADVGQRAARRRARSCCPRRCAGRATPIWTPGRRAAGRCSRWCPS